MGIQRQAEDPGLQLVHGETIKYSLTSTTKTSPKKNAPIAPMKPASLGKDVLLTLVLFALAVGIIFFLSLRLG